jgi:hypothetical protein
MVAVNRGVFSNMSHTALGGPQNNALQLTKPAQAMELRS